MNALRRFWNDESGASAAEYALILALIGSGIAVAAFALGGEVKESLDGTEKCLNAANSGKTVSDTDCPPNAAADD
jgi:pilus assembly protein Flp/PilA